MVLSVVASPRNQIKTPVIVRLRGFVVEEEGGEKVVRGGARRHRSNDPDPLCLQDIHHVAFDKVLAAVSCIARFDSGMTKPVQLEA